MREIPHHRLQAQDFQSDTTQGGYVSRVGRSNSEQSHCVLVYLYRNNDAVWPTVEKCYIFKKRHVHMEHPKNCTFTIVNVQTGAHLVAQTCESCAIS